MIIYAALFRQYIIIIYTHNLFDIRNIHASQIGLLFKRGAFTALVIASFIGWLWWG